MKRFCPYTNYGWGWDIGLFGWWLVWSRCDGRHMYVSNDATPPCDQSRGFTIYRRRA